MSNFQELQAYKLEWKLNHDESLFEKMDYLQDNVLACSHLVHNSISELNRAINASGTTLSNAINAFNQLNHTKFLENVVEDMHDAEQKREVMHQERQQEILSESVHLIGVNGEKEKIQFALELAIHEVSKKRKAAEAGEEDADNLDESRASIDRRKENKKKGYAGTSSLLKLPFVINTPEFKKHLYAGVVYLNTDVEQVELFQEEQQAKIQDKKMETKVLQENAEAIVQVERAIEQAVQMNVANIPAPPLGDLGNIPPPPGFGVAYVPALVAGGVMKKPEATLPSAQSQVQSQNNMQQDNQGRTEQNSGGMAQNPAIIAQTSIPAEQAAANDQYAGNPLFSGGWRRPTEKAQQSSLFDPPAAPTQQMPTGPNVDIYAMMNNANQPLTSGGLFKLEDIGGDSSGPAKTAGDIFDDEEDNFQKELVKPKSAEAVIAKATAPPQKPKPKGMWDVEEDDDDFGKKAKPATKAAQVKSNLLDSDDDEEDFKPTVKTVASKTVATKKVNVLDSDSDEKPQVKAAPQKKMALLDSEDDDLPPKKASVVAPKKQLLDSDDSDESPPVKQPVAALKKTQQATKKNFLDSDDDDDDFKPPAKVTPPPAKAAPVKAKQDLFGNSDESDGFKPPAKPQVTAAKPVPTRVATVVEKKKSLLDSGDEDDVKPQAQKNIVTAPQATPPKSVIKKPVVVSDDDDFSAPPVTKPVAPPQSAPPKSVIKKPVVVSDDDDDFQAKPARSTVKFQDLPKQAPEPQKQAPVTDESSPPRLSIAQLAAKINLAALDPSKNPNLASNKEAERRATVVQSRPLTTANTSTNLDHANFAFKPILKKRPAAVKKMEFVDSEEESAPLAHAQTQNYDQHYQNDQYNQQSTYNQYDHQQYDQNQYYDYNQQHQQYDPTEYHAQQKDPSMPRQPRPSQLKQQRPQVAEEVPQPKQQQPAQKKQMFEDSEEEEVKPKAVIAPVVEVKKPLPTFDADSDDEPVPQAKAQKPSAAMLVMQAKQPVPAAKKKVASKFANSDDEDSSEEDKPYNPPPTKSQAEQIAQSNPRSTATTVKKVTDFSDDSDEDFSYKPKTAVQPKAAAQTKPVIPVQAAKKKMLFDSDDD